MKIKSPIFFATIYLLCISCKNTNSSGSEDRKDTIKQEIAGGEERVTEKASSPKQIKAWNASANSILKFRKEKSSKPYSIIDVGVWEYKFEFLSGMKQPKAIDGNWIDYNQDLTYEYGYYDQIQGRGKYHFDLDTGLMLMVDDDETKPPHEYKLKLVNDICIFQGESTYGDGGMQAKLEKIPQRPKK